MVLHVALSPKSLRALRAGERPLIFMDSLMDLQVLLFCKRFTTCWKYALERFRPKVHVHVCFETDASLERLATVFMWAEKQLDGVRYLGLAPFFNLTTRVLLVGRRSCIINVMTEFPFEKDLFLEWIVVLWETTILWECTLQDWCSCSLDAEDCCRWALGLPGKAFIFGHFVLKGFFLLRQFFSTGKLRNRSRSCFQLTFNIIENDIKIFMFNW